jgi:CelD/BcsL family acetyltransferase involved in cellulose biosynthesis
VNWTGGTYEGVALEGTESFRALREAWRRLESLSDDVRVSETFDWARVCAEARRWNGAERLVSLAVRRGGQVAAILPLVVSRAGPVRSARPLACETTEYCPVLLDPAADPRQVWAALEAQVRALPDLDVLFLASLREDAALAGVVKDGPGSTAVNPLPAPYLRRSAFGSWESYWAQRSNQVRTNVSRGRKRLERQGEIRFEELTDPEERRAVWRWMVANKREWLSKKGLYNQFVFRDDYPGFIEATLDVDGPSGRRAIFVLKLDGRVIAAELSNVDRRRVEVFVLCYDAEFGACAPGNLLRREVLAWAFERGLDYDWRLGGEAYKFEWASDSIRASTHVLALSARGRLFVAYLATRAWLARRASGRARAKVRAALRSAGLG